eukprot:TRINITY_DN2065_c0_g1_i1.p1 TRINITY_DN2065_c0_g1~~TRINITY_DN2065_c0_g1_i1.p1  ORF type:complete len:518 (+),score=123.70 TRINITY_DN2065_c0_g1_i1:95-1648(+)
MVVRACAVALLTATMAGRPKIVLEGHEDMDMPPNDPNLKVPEYITKWTDDTLYPDLQRNDVLVMYMREQHCPDCDIFARYFYKAAEQLKDVPGVAVGQIDVHEEGEIFQQYHNVEEDLPAIMVFKAENTIKFRKKPVQFVVNSRVATDLAPFVHRLLGAPHRTISNTTDWEALLADGTEHSDGVVVGMWKPPGLPQRSAAMADVIFRRISELERYNLLFGLIAPDTHSDFEGLAAGRNPVFDSAEGGHPVLVVYETSFDPPRGEAYVLKTKRDVKKEMKSVRNWLEHAKTKRKGHKYDRMVNYFQEDLFVPENCSESRRVEGKAYVHLKMLGRSSSTGVVVMDMDTKFVTGENAHMKGVDRGVMGMCEGMRRMLVLPLEWREGVPAKEKDQWQIHNTSNLLLEATLWSVQDSHKMPGRIEWEQDPEKIAAHQRKVEEREKEREEAIARGDDPDAECKMEAEVKQKEEEKKKPKMRRTRLKVVRGADGKDSYVEVPKTETPTYAGGNAGGPPPNDETE